MEVPGIPGVLRFSGGTRFLGSPGVPRLPGVLQIPGILEFWNFNWLCKHIEKIRSSQDFILTNSCTEFTFRSRIYLVMKFWCSWKNLHDLHDFRPATISAFKVCTLSNTYKISIVLFYMDYCRSLVLLSHKLLRKYTKYQQNQIWKWMCT